jgi:hypothetical protein
MLQAPTMNLCNAAKNKQKTFLYRMQLANMTGGSNDCPKMFTGWATSYDITYREYLSENGAYADQCGQPRSELNSCFRRQASDPQFNINLGPCPDTTLVHRRSLTQNVKCIGKWTK